MAKPASSRIPRGILWALGAVLLLLLTLDQVGARAFGSFGTAALFLFIALPDATDRPSAWRVYAVKLVLALGSAACLLYAAWLEDRDWRRWFNVVIGVLVLLMGWFMARTLRGLLDGTLPALGVGPLGEPGPGMVTVRLVAVGTDRLATIGMLRAAIPSLDLVEAKGLADEAAAGRPALITDGATPAQAASIGSMLSTVGARVESAVQMSE